MPGSGPGFRLTAFRQNGTVRSAVRRNRNSSRSRDDAGDNPVFGTDLRARHDASRTKAMKHQYFGDSRDLFKYDLLSWLITDVPGICRLIIVPMLTPDDGSTDGGRILFRESHPGYRNAALRRFLSAHHASRNLTRIADYFRTQGLCTDIFNPVFTAKDRSRYFDSAIRFCTGLPGSLIFLDPDTGLEVRHPGEKHLLFSELRAVCSAADSPSLIMVYQHFPRVSRDAYVALRLTQLRNCCRRHPLALADRQVAFFLLPTPDIEDRVRTALHRYAGGYPVLRCWS